MRLRKRISRVKAAANKTELKKGKDCSWLLITFETPKIEFVGVD